jgi:hypothetical protein
MRNMHVVKITVAVLLSCLMGCPSCKLSSPAGASTADLKVLQKALQAIYDQQNVYLARKDINAIWKRYTDDYVSVSQDGEERTQAELRAAMERLFKMAKSIKSTSLVQNVVLEEEVEADGSVSSVQLVDEVDEVATLVLVHPESGREVTVVSTTRDRETWVKVAGEWFIKRTETISSKITVDGEVVPDSDRAQTGDDIQPT